MKCEVLLLVLVLGMLVDVLRLPVPVGTFLILFGVSFGEVVGRVPLLLSLAARKPLEIAVGVWVGAISGTGELEAPFTKGVSDSFSDVWDIEFSVIIAQFLLGIVT